MTLADQQKAKGWLDIWKDNSDPENINKGIISFSRMLFPRVIEPKYGIPDIHKEMYFELLQLYHPNRTMLSDRQLQFELNRDASKSTCGVFIFGCYVACMNGHEIIIADTKDNYKDYIVYQGASIDLSQCLNSYKGVKSTLEEDMVLIMSETHAMAENWTLKIREQLSTNRKIKQVFGSMKPESKLDDEGKWTASNFRCLKDKATMYSWQKGRDLDFVAKGATQQSRGLNTLGRVTLFLADDLYSLKTVLTVDTRQKTRYRFSAEAKNGVDKNKGKIVSIGTKVHEDTVITDNERNRRYRVIKHCAMDKDSFMYILNNHCTIDSEQRLCIVPNKQECKELENSGFVTNWKERLSLEILLNMYSEAFEGKQEGRTLSMFWQEYFHEVMSEEDKKFKRENMKDLDFELVSKAVNGVVHTFVEIPLKDGKFTYRNVNTCIGIDSAISFSQGADDTAIIWIAKDYYDRIYIYRCKNGKYGVNDEIVEDKEQEYLGKLCKELKDIKRIGSSDEIFRWVDNKPTINCKFVIETNSIGAETTRQVNKKKLLYGKMYQVIEVCQSKQKKEDRIYDQLGKYADSRAMFFKEGAGLETLKTQLEFLGKTSKDDCADICGTTAQELQKPYINITDLKVIEEPGKFKTWIQKQARTTNPTQNYNRIWKT